MLIRKEDAIKALEDLRNALANYHDRMVVDEALARIAELPEVGDDDLK